MTTSNTRSPVDPVDRPQAASPPAGGITIGTLPTWEGGIACCLGRGPFAAPTIGQIITAPAGAATLQRFAFALQLSATLTVQGAVYGWDGQHAVGPALFTGTSATHSELGRLAEIGFTTGGIAIEPGRCYVLLVTTTPETDQHASGVFGIMAGDHGRGYVYLNDQLEQSQWTSTQWQTGEFALAFAATFA